MVIDAINAVQVLDTRRFGISGIKAISLRSRYHTLYCVPIVICTTSYLDSSKSAHGYLVDNSSTKHERDREAVTMNPELGIGASKIRLVKSLNPCPRGFLLKRKAVKYAKYIMTGFTTSYHGFHSSWFQKSKYLKR